MKILFCDWNGTLLDDVEIWEQAMRKTCLAFGKQPPTSEEYFEELASGDYLSVYRKRGIIAPREELSFHFHTAYATQMHRLQLSDKAGKTLLLLKKRGTYLVLLTANPRILTVPLLEKFSLYDLFEEHFFHTVDKKEFIERVVRGQCAHPKDCFMIGDMPSDMRHAKQSGIGAIGFLNQANSEASLTAAGADYCVHRLDELVSLLV